MIRPAYEFLSNNVTKLPLLLYCDAWKIPNTDSMRIILNFVIKIWCELLGLNTFWRHTNGTIECMKYRRWFDSWWLQQISQYVQSISVNQNRRVQFIVHRFIAGFMSCQCFYLHNQVCIVFLFVVLKVCTIDICASFQFAMSICIEIITAERYKSIGQSIYFIRKMNRSNSEIEQTLSPDQFQ